MEEYLHNSLTGKIIELFYKVYNELGYGFLEKVYETTLFIELEKAGLKIKRQAPVQVKYDGRIIGEYIADILVENKIILEIKAAKQLTQAHEAQLLNYLRATGKEIGLLLNFGPKPEIRRKIFTPKTFK